MKIRKATSNDISAIVAMLADDELGKKREHFTTPLPETYQSAFNNIENDPNQELMVAESETGEVIGTLQLTFIQYLTYQGGVRAQKPFASGKISEVAVWVATCFNGLLAEQKKEVRMYFNLLPIKNVPMPFGFMRLWALWLHMKA